MSWSCEKMGDEKLTKRADTHKVEGMKKTEIAMGNCIKSGLERLGEEWGKKDR